MRSNSSNQEVKMIMNCFQILNQRVKGYSPDTLWELLRNYGTKEECELLLSWLERIYG